MKEQWYVVECTPCPMCGEDSGPFTTTAHFEIGEVLACDRCIYDNIKVLSVTEAPDLNSANILTVEKSNMITEYYFECECCGRWYEDETSLAYGSTCVHCTGVEVDEDNLPISVPF